MSGVLDAGPDDPQADRWGELIAGEPSPRCNLVLRILRGPEPLEAVAREAGVPPDLAERWTQEFVAAGERALRVGGAVPGTALSELHIGRLERKLGEMALEMDRLRKLLASQEHQDF